MLRSVQNWGLYISIKSSIFMSLNEGKVMAQPIFHTGLWWSRHIIIIIIIIIT